jgi:hypothetical protein
MCENVNRGAMKKTVQTQLVIAAIITVPALVISFLAGLALGLPGLPPEIPPVDAVPVDDVPGEDVPGVPRYPGAVRVRYENHLLEDVRVWEVDYLAEGRLHETGSFYRQRLDENGWVLEGTNFDAGELDMRAHRGNVAAVVEIEQEGELVQIDIDVYEPSSSLSGGPGHPQRIAPGETSPITSQRRG